MNSFFSKNIKNIFYDILFDYLKLYATKTNILPISTLIHSFNYRRISIPLYKIFCNGIFKKRKVQRYRYSYLYSYLEICIAVYRHTSRNFYINTSNVYEIEIIVAFAVHLKIVISKIHTLLYYCVMYNKLLLIANTKNSTINNVNIIFINSTIYYFYNLNIKYFSLSKPYFLFLYTTRFIDFFHSFSNFNSDIFYDYETNKNLL